MSDDEYRIIVRDLPPGVNGAIAKQDDFCTVFINARLTAQQQKEAAIHEIEHYGLGHMDDLEKPVKVKEAEVEYRVKNTHSEWK